MNCMAVKPTLNFDLDYNYTYEISGSWSFL